VTETCAASAGEGHRDVQPTNTGPAARVLSGLQVRTVGSGQARCGSAKAGKGKPEGQAAKARDYIDDGPVTGWTVMPLSGSLRGLGARRTSPTQVRVPATRCWALSGAVGCIPPLASGR
jgi:hypothetical protein